MGSLPWASASAGAGGRVELLHNNVHHIERISRDVMPGPGGNGLGVAVYGTDANTPISELVIDGDRSLTSRQVPANRWW